MAYVLATHGVLNYEGDRSEEITSRAARAGLNSVRLNTIKTGDHDDVSDDDFNDD